jgi:alkylhydroperoxidase/carboxymuconolactone decarboxylase family protein YurZ
MLAKKAGASREEIISAIMVGLPAVGNEVINAYEEVRRDQVPEKALKEIDPR